LVTITTSQALGLLKFTIVHSRGPGVSKATSSNEPPCSSNLRCIPSRSMTPMIFAPTVTNRSVDPISDENPPHHLPFLSRSIRSEMSQVMYPDIACPMTATQVQVVSVDSIDCDLQSGTVLSNPPDTIQSDDHVKDQTESLCPFRTTPVVIVRPKDGYRERHQRSRRHGTYSRRSLSPENAKIRIKTIGIRVRTDLHTSFGVTKKNEPCCQHFMRLWPVWLKSHASNKEHVSFRIQEYRTRHQSLDPRVSMLLQYLL